MEEWALDSVTGVGAAHVDICNDSQICDLFCNVRPDWTVLAAAYTDVDGCERDRGKAFQVNCFAAANVAREARKVGSKLLFVSTDYVFDGSKNSPYETDDPVNPVSVYGQSKAEAEKLVREVLPECCIARTAWLFGATGRCFPNKILELAETQKSLKVVHDQVGTPTFNRDLAKAIIQLVRVNAHGIIHVTNSGPCSWSEFACEILKGNGNTDVKVEPVPTDDVPRPAARPKYSVLSNVSAQRYRIEIRTWREALADYFIERRSSSIGKEPILIKTAICNSNFSDLKEGQ
jgi:dTDP-4-dehydrorhamnose reductase